MSQYTARRSPAFVLQLVVAFLCCGAVEAVAADATNAEYRSTGVKVTGPTEGVPGDVVCFFVSGPGASSFSFSVDVEGSGGASPYAMQISDGVYLVCFVIPDVPPGTAITVSASAAGRTGSATLVVN